MDLKAILGLRPKTEGAAGIRDALAATEAAKAAAAARITQLEADRARTLLDGTAAQVAKAEADLAEARAEAERCDAIRAGLRERLARAEASEAVETARAAIREAEEANVAFVAFAQTKYPGLAKQIIAGAKMEYAARDARQRASVLLNRLPVELQEGLALPPDPLTLLDGRPIRGSFAASIHLPSETDLSGDYPHWPATRRPAQGGGA